jgi:GH24 family phage-related lysozyme (muramidase)/LysM repeat protein
MAISCNLNSSRSVVTVYLKDRFGQPIRNLKVEIKGIQNKADTVYHAAMTDAKGLIQFSVQKGEDLSVHVKRWTEESMKEIARVNASLEEISFRLTSPKSLHETHTKVDDPASGDYWRGTYRVKSHDTLTGIARKYHTSVDLLKHVNHLASDLIKIGQVLKVPPVESRKSSTPVPKKPVPKGHPPQTEKDKNASGAPTTTPRNGPAPIIFPVRVRPLNDEGAIYGSEGCNYTWSKPLDSGGHNQARYGARREGGHRKHAGRDLYLEKYTEIVAIAPGIVIKCENFYCGTDQISIHHKTMDGREFITLYGEVHPPSINVKINDRVNQGDVIAKSGVLMHANGTPLRVVGNANVSMLHFESYSGEKGFSSSSILNGTSLPGDYQRRSDLTDSLVFLQEGYRATFLDALPLSVTGSRISITQLKASQKGKEFIKGWEGVFYDDKKENTYYYDDSKGYCTVGWGHLVARKSCDTLGFVAKSSKIPLDKAQDLFDIDVAIHECYVREAISAPLYQHEFDALVSLAFNVGHIAKVAPKLCQKLNGCDYTGAPKEFLDIENKTRRQREYDIFCQYVYNSNH